MLHLSYKSCTPTSARSILVDWPVDNVGAAFFYATTGRTVRPVDLLDETALEHLVTGG